MQVVDNEKNYFLGEQGVQSDQQSGVTTDLPYSSNPLLKGHSINYDEDELLGEDELSQSKDKSTDTEASVNIFKNFLGSAVLGLPYAWSQTGWILSLIIFLFVCGLIYYVTVLLLQIMIDMRKKVINFDRVYQKTLGPKWVSFYSFAVAIYKAGGCSAFVIFFVSFFQEAFGYLGGPTNREIYVLLSLVIIIPMVTINNYHKFARFSLMANIMGVAVLIVVTEYNMEKLIGNSNSSQISLNFGNQFNWRYIFDFFGVSVYSYGTITNLFPIRNSMQRPSHIIKVFTHSSIQIIIVYLVFAISTSLAFGNDVQQIVLKDMARIRMYFFIVQFIYAFSIIITFPLKFYLVWDAVETMSPLTPWIKANPSKFRRLLPRYTLLFICFAIAYLIPKFVVFQNILGSFVALTLQFLYPILAYNNYYKTVISRKKKIFNLVLMVFAFTVSLIALVKSTISLFE